MTADDAPALLPGGGPPQLGERIRSSRQARGLSVRELARRLGVSASLISQIERGKASPSVGTLYGITSLLGISLDELFVPETSTPSGHLPPRVGNGLTGLVVRSGARRTIHLHSGVRWEQLTPSSDPDIDFLHVVYEPGGASCEPSALMRHAGREYGHVLSGRLEVTIGFEAQELGPGDSISFDSTMPHRLATKGDEPVTAIWFVVGRGGDARVGGEA